MVSLLYHYLHNASYKAVIHPMHLLTCCAQQEWVRANRAVVIESDRNFVRIQLAEILAEAMNAGCNQKMIFMQPVFWLLLRCRFHLPRLLGKSE
ncbi:MAG: hypothetical protein FWG30_09330 [Eubacteriaceae bacterium]|nr:hypothetical protein [Eubacteriaceae bacterium]